MPGLETIRGLVRNGLNGLGLELVRSDWAYRAGLRPDLRQLVAQTGPKTVFDVGANNGQFYRMLRESVGYRGRIVSFEPNPALGDDLRALQRRDSHWSVESVALGAEPGELLLNVSRRSDFSSFRSPNATARELFPMSETAQTVNVPVITLDDYVKRATLETPYLLKLDTQGFDNEVVKGAQNTLRDCQAVLCELSVIHIYDGQIDWKSMIDILTSQGFRIAGLYPVTRTKALEVIEFDCLMVRGS
jgi:FkbM family methyltransferase